MFCHRHVPRLKKLIILCAAVLIGFSIHGITYLSVPKDSHSDYDYDMTSMGKDMRYALTANIMNHPEEYLDRTIKADGTFYAYPAGNDHWQYAIFISDTLGCCSAGIPMILSEDFQKPENGAAITVCGTLKYVEYAGRQQISLQDAKVTVK